MRLIILLGISAVAANNTFGQTAPRPAFADSSPVRIMAHVGSHPNVPWLGEILRQVKSTYSRTKLDELGDSLVARAMDPRAIPTDTFRYRAAVEGVLALMLSGFRTTVSGQPYAGAMDRLIKIHQAAPVRGIRHTALGALLSLPDRTRALAYMRDVAESNDATAYDAVEYLITDASGGSWGGVSPTSAQAQASTAILREMASRHHMADPHASRLLEGWMSAHR
jgi:hypothetical protein